MIGYPIGVLWEVLGKTPVKSLGAVAASGRGTGWGSRRGYPGPALPLLAVRLWANPRTFLNLSPFIQEPAYQAHEWRCAPGASRFWN